MIYKACPAIVLDDKKEHLWAITHGLSVCGFPVIPHWVREKELHFKPTAPYEGIRLVFTDLHILGDEESNPAALSAALILFLKRLVAPSTYLLVFWSDFGHEAEEVWNLVCQRVPPGLRPFGMEKISKVNVQQVSDHDKAVSDKAIANVQGEIEAIFQKYPQLKALLNMESCISTAAGGAVNGLVGAIEKGDVKFADHLEVQKVMRRMSQEALGSAHASSRPATGFAQAMLPILQDVWERMPEDIMPAIQSFIAPLKKGRIDLPGTVAPRLNDFFIHAEGHVKSATERGALINLAQDYLSRQEGGFCSRVGLNGDTPGDWKESICSEFVLRWRNERGQQFGIEAKDGLDQQHAYVVELSPECDHAQNKQRSHRFFLAVFVPIDRLRFFSEFDDDGEPTFEAANAAIYVTPAIFLRNVQGHLFISCRQFISKPHNQSPPGECVSRLRKETLDELAHHYATHLRRPGKISFD